MAGSPNRVRTSSWWRAVGATPRCTPPGSVSRGRTRARSLQPPESRGWSTRSREGLLEVGQQIVSRLDAGAEAYEPGRDGVPAPPLAALGGRSDATEAGRLVDEPTAREEPLSNLGVGELEADDPAEPNHLPARQIVARVVRKAGEADRPDRRMRLQ